MSYEIIRNGAPTGIIIKEVKSKMEASLKYMEVMDRKTQYNTTSIKVTFKEVQQ